MAKVTPNPSAIPETLPVQGAVPKVVYGEGIDPSICASPQEFGNTMRELGISEKKIGDSAIYLDPKSRFQVFGTHYPSFLNTITRKRFHSIPELQDVRGDTVRLSTVMKGKPRPSEKMNITAVHELEHIAQADRKDIKVIEGNLAIWGLAALGASVGVKLGGRNKATRTIVGAAAGHTLGYLIAPHERQARKRAGQGRGRAAQVTTTAIKRK